MNKAMMNKKHIPFAPYMIDYYNVHAYYQPTNFPKEPAARVVTSLIDAFDSKKRLPKTMIVIMDKDILKGEDLQDREAHAVLNKTVNWLVKEFDIQTKRRQDTITEARPGAVFADDPTIIFIRMLRRVEHQPLGSRLDTIFSFRSKFNDSLNDAARKIEQKMLTINSCNTSAHYDRWGQLTIRGETDYWKELDELVEKFDLDKIKLRPNPIPVPGKQDYYRKKDNNRGNRHQLPRPPPNNNTASYRNY